MKIILIQLVKKSDGTKVPTVIKLKRWGGGLRPNGKAFEKITFLRLPIPTRVFERLFMPGSKYYTGSIPE